MLIPIELIRDPATPVRRTPESAEDVASLRLSIGALGLLEPIIVRPRGDTEYELIAGGRRLNACRALGHKQIKAEIEIMHDSQALAAAAAENMVREPMAPLDQWRAIAGMRRDGYTIEHAAIAVGVSLRHARRLEKCGSLHPDVLAAIEKHGMPSDHALRQIASAPAAAQQAAVKKMKGGSWNVASTACQTARIPRSRAIFDVESAGVVFEEDLFVENASDAFFTTDTAGFLAAQTAALQAKVAETVKKKRRAQIGELTKQGSIKVPKGFVQTYTSVQSARKTDTVLYAIVREGYSIGEITAIVVRPKPTDKKKPAAKPVDKQPDPVDGDADPIDADADPVDEAEDGDARQPEELPPEEGRTITAAGRAIIAKAKTEALRAHLANCADRYPEELLCWLVVALTADWVHYEGDGASWEQHKMLDLAADLVPPEGGAALRTEQAGAAALKALARLLHIKDGKNCDPAEWIGHAAGADAALPRFDTPELLATISGAELRRIAEAQGMKPAKTVAGLRQQLAGAAPNWRPPGAEFGAPGPKAR